MPMRSVSITPVPVYRAPAYGVTGRTVTVSNTDTLNRVYYSDGPGTIDAQSSFIDPGGTETFDGQSDVWVSTLSQAVTVVVQLKIGSSSYNPGTVNISNSNIDVNLTNSTVNVAGSVNNFNQVNITHVANSVTINAGTSILNWAPSPIPNTAQGYLIAFRGQNPGDLYALDVQIDHYGPDGKLVGTEYFTLTNYDNRGSSFHQVALRGKLIGSSVQISVWNASATWWQTVTGTALTVSAWAQLYFYVTPFDYPGESQIVGSFNDRIVVPGNQTQTITAGGTIDTCASYEGMVSGYFFNNTPGTSTVQFQIQSYTVQNGTTPVGNIWFPQLSAGQLFNGLFSMDNLLNIIAVALRSGASATVQYGISAVD